MLTHKGTQMIETTRLLLRRAVREDAEPMFRNWASDPEVTKYLTWPAYERVESGYQILDLWSKEYEKTDYYFIINNYHLHSL
jgi:ribosomal-protein-alanine N-acetyltransferase